MLFPRAFARHPALALALALAFTLFLSSAAQAKTSVTSDLSALDLIELQIGYTTLLATYYRPVTPRTLAGGARTGIASYLLSRGIADPQLPYLPERLDRGTGGDFIDSAVVGSVLRFGKRVSPNAIVQAALAGEATAVHDPYTLLFHPQQFRKFNTYLNGDDFGGIGAVVTVERSARRARVESVIADSPAARAGMQPADEILEIDGRPPASDGSAVLAALRGKVGTTVRLTVARAGTPLAAPLVLVRTRITPPLVLAKLVEDGIGYVQLTRFGDDAAAQMVAALSMLERQGARSLILDLRANGGGYGDEAKRVASAFIASGPIFATRERGGTTNVEQASGKVAFTGKLVVLVDGDTASAAEIVAGALQDDGRALLVGTKTFGKGVVQSIYPLPDGAALKVTTARYFTPRGRNIDGAGLVPDAIVTQPADAIRGDPAEDPQLRRAVQLLQ